MAHSAPSKAISTVSLQVARSLGITEFLRRKETPTCSSQETEGRLEKGCVRKRARELGKLVSGVDRLCACRLCACHLCGCCLCGCCLCACHLWVSSVCASSVWTSSVWLSVWVSSVWVSSVWLLSLWLSSVWVSSVCMTWPCQFTAHPSRPLQEGVGLPVLLVSDKGVFSP